MQCHSNYGNPRLKSDKYAQIVKNWLKIACLDSMLVSTTPTLSTHDIDTLKDIEKYNLNEFTFQFEEP